jgi:hypothetical protein
MRKIVAMNPEQALAEWAETALANLNSTNIQQQQDATCFFATIAHTIAQANLTSNPPKLPNTYLDHLKTLLSPITALLKKTTDVKVQYYIAAFFSYLAAIQSTHPHILPAIPQLISLLGSPNIDIQHAVIHCLANLATNQTTQLHILSDIHSLIKFSNSLSLDNKLSEKQQTIQRILNRLFQQLGYSGCPKPQTPAAPHFKDWSFEGIQQHPPV